MLAFIMMITAAFLVTIMFVIVLFRSEKTANSRQRSNQATIPIIAADREDSSPGLFVHSRGESGGDIRDSFPAKWSPSVLIVEDQPHVREMLLSFLADKTVSLREAGTGSAAISLLRQMKFDYVLLDLGLPDMNGIEVLRKLRQEDGKAQVILISAYIDPSLQEEAERLGVLGQYSKPFDIRQLWEVMERDLAAKTMQEGAD